MRKPIVKDVFDVDKEEKPFRVSLSVSPFTESVLASGIRFTDSRYTAQSVEEMQRLFMKYGANEIYARIGTIQTSGETQAHHSLEKGLEKARLAHKLGLPINPELGLFATYGDITHQPPPDFSEYPEIEVPASWDSLTLEQMLSALQKYGEIVGRMILDTGTEVRIWDIGNEIEFGLAGVAPQPMPFYGPIGRYKPPNRVDPEIGKMSCLELLRMSEQKRIGWLQMHIWPYLTKILTAVADGIRSVDTDARFSTHVSGHAAVRSDEAIAFYQALREGGFFPDELGFSFYPSASDQPPMRLKAFKTIVHRVKEEFDRPIFIAEYSYPAKPMHTGPFANWNHQTDHYPLTPHGQADLLHDLVSWGVTAEISGIRPWAPDLVMPEWEPMALFDLKEKTANSRPSLGSFVEGLATPNSDALKA